MSWGRSTIEIVSGRMRPAAEHATVRKKEKGERSGPRARSIKGMSQLGSKHTGGNLLLQRWKGKRNATLKGTRKGEAGGSAVAITFYFISFSTLIPRAAGERPIQLQGGKTSIPGGANEKGTRADDASSRIICRGCFGSARADLSNLGAIERTSRGGKASAHPHWRSDEGEPILARENSLYNKAAYEGGCSTCAGKWREVLSRA